MSLAEAFYRAASANLKHPLTPRIAVLLDKPRSRGRGQQNTQHRSTTKS